MSKVTVKINPKTQEMTVEVDGVQGGKCTDITAALLENNEVVEQQYTSEFHEETELPDYITDQTGEE